MKKLTRFFLMYLNSSFVHFVPFVHKSFGKIKAVRTKAYFRSLKSPMSFAYRFVRLVSLSLLIGFVLTFAAAASTDDNNGLFWLFGNVPERANSLAGASGTSIFAPTAGVGDVAVDVGYNTLYKLNAADGTILWGPVAKGNCGGLAVDQLDFSVYTGASPNCTGGGTASVYKYDTSGALVWNTPYAGCGFSGNYYVASGGIAVDTTSGTKGVVLSKTGDFGDIGKVSRLNGSTIFCDGTNDLGRPTIDPVNGQIYAITNAGPGYNYNTVYSVTAAGGVGSAGSCEGFTDLNPADGMLYRGGNMATNGCGLTLYQMNKSNLAVPNWSMSIAPSGVTSFDAIAVQPWLGGYIYAASVSSSKIVVINPATQTVVRSFTTTVTPNYIAVNPSGGNIYLTNGANFVYAYSEFGTLVWTSPNLGGPTNSVAAARDIVGLAPTAASVFVSGRILTADGRGLRNATLTMNDSKGVSRRALSSSFGYYRFDDVQAGETYVISVSSKLFRFAPQVVSVNDSLANINFVAQ